MAGQKAAVGIVGLGIMGGAFAKNLVGRAVGGSIGYDIDASRRRAWPRPASRSPPTPSARG